MVLVHDELSSLEGDLVWVSLEHLGGDGSLGIWVYFLRDPQIVDQDCEVAVIAVINHGNHCMWVNSVRVWENRSNNSWFPRSPSLDDPYTLSNFEALFDLVSFSLDLKWFLLVSHEVHEAILNVLNESLAVFELSLVHFDSVAYLDL